MSTITRRAFASGIALLPSLRFTAAEAQASVTPAEARAIAKAAYIYGFPWWTTIESSTPIGWIARTQNTRGPGIRSGTAHDCSRPPTRPFKRLTRTRLLLRRRGPACRANRAHCSGDEKTRYFSVQLIDYYTFNFDYIGTRTTGNGGGSFLLAGPG